MSQEKKLKLHVVLRTCDKVSAVHGNKRICGEASKQEIVVRCVSSLLESLSQISQLVDVKMSVVDDHSSPELLSWLGKVTPKGTQIISVEDPGGVGQGILKGYETAALIESDVVYLVEDDYIHAPSAIGEMLDAFVNFRKNLGDKEVAIVPNDDPLDYKMDRITPCRLVQGSRRHWRTNDHTCWTVMISRYALIHNFKQCEAFGQYGKDPRICEDNTINLMYRGGGISLFSPVPSLGAHLCGDDTRLCDWRFWWNRNVKKISIDNIMALYGDESINNVKRHDYQEVNEMKAMLALVKHFNVKSVLEIGVNRGYTAENLLKNCSSIERYVGVDVTMESIPNMSRQYDEVTKLNGEAGIQVRDNPKFELFCHKDGSKSLDKDKKFEMVIVDGDHSVEWALFDTDLARQVLTGPKIIVWHDYPSEPGVAMVVDNCGLPVIWVEGTRTAFSVNVK